MQLPPVEPNVYAPPPERCPCCGNPTFHSHGGKDKPIRDTRLDGVIVRRIQCPQCDKTVRLYPQGITARDQSERVRGFSVLLWLLGLSYRGVEDALAGLGVVLKKSQIWNNVQAVGERVRQLQEKRLGQRRVRVLAGDCTHVRVHGHDTVVLQLTDGERGLFLAIELLDGESQDDLQGPIGEVAAAVGAEVFLSDDADPMKAVADELGLEHAVCQQHVVPNKLTLLMGIVGQLEKLRESGRLDAAGQVRVRQALADVQELEDLLLWRVPGCQGRLEALARQYEQEPLPGKGQRATPFARLKLLTMDLAANWPRLTLTESRRDAQGRRFVPATNNVSEQQIGLNIKERYRPMRGYKSERSLRRVVTLTAYLRDAHDPQALIQALAA
jgi:transposase-like protein